MGAEKTTKATGTTIRACRAEDAGRIASILQECPEAAEWSPASLREALNWTNVIAIVSEEAGNATGFVLARQAGDEAELLNLAVAPTRRRNGLGNALVRALLEELASQPVGRVFLEVRESNQTGIAFYLKLGFVKTGRRPRYYRGPEETAILMEKKFTGLRP